MYKWLTKLIADITGKTMRDEHLRKDAERKEQDRLKREAMLSRARPTPSPYGHYRSYPVSSSTTTTQQQDNTALHLGIMAMAMSEPTKTVDSCRSESYTDNSSNYGGSDYTDTGSSCSVSSID